MSTPSCVICGRWDGTHSGGCERTGHDYKAFHAMLTIGNDAWVARETVEKDLVIAEKSYVINPFHRASRMFGPVNIHLTGYPNGDMDFTVKCDPSVDERDRG